MRTATFPKVIIAPRTMMMPTLIGQWASSTSLWESAFESQWIETFSAENIFPSQMRQRFDIFDTQSKGNTQRRGIRHLYWLPLHTCATIARGAYQSRGQIAKNTWLNRIHEYKWVGWGLWTCKHKRRIDSVDPLLRFVHFGAIFERLLACNQIEVRKLAAHKKHFISQPISMSRLYIYIIDLIYMYIKSSYIYLIQYRIGPMIYYFFTWKGRGQTVPHPVTPPPHFWKNTDGDVSQRWETNDCCDVCQFKR